MANYSIQSTPAFKREYKKLVKKYPRSQEEIDSVISSLEAGNLVGDEYDNIGLPDDEKIIKVRIANIDANKGKSGGFRLIYYAIISDETILLLSIYSKSDTVNLTQAEIIEILKKYDIIL